MEKTTVEKINELYHQYHQTGADTKKLYTTLMKLTHEVLEEYSSLEREFSRDSIISLMQHVNGKQAPFAATVFQILMEQDDEFYHDTGAACDEDSLSIPDSCYPVLFKHNIFSTKMLNLNEEYYLLRTLLVLYREELAHAHDYAIAFSFLEELKERFYQFEKEKKSLLAIATYAALSNFLTDLHPELLDDSMELYDDEYEGLYEFATMNRTVIETMLANLDIEVDWSLAFDGPPLKEKNPELTRIFHVSSVCYHVIEKYTTPSYLAERVANETITHWYYYWMESNLNFTDFPMDVQLAMVNQGMMLDKALFATEEVRTLLAKHPSHAPLLLNDICGEVVENAVKTLHYPIELVDHPNTLVRIALAKANVGLDVLKWDNDPAMKKVLNK